jgi:hypothetical protein
MEREMEGCGCSCRVIRKMFRHSNPGRISEVFYLWISECGPLPIGISGIVRGRQHLGDRRALAMSQLALSLKVTVV